MSNPNITLNAANSNVVEYDQARHSYDRLWAFEPSANAPMSLHALKSWQTDTAQQKTISGGWFYTPWPIIGGADLITGSSSLFSSPSFLDRYRQGETREIYCAATEGLGQLANQLNLSLNKIGDCAAGRLYDRMQELSTVKYGGLYRNQYGELVEESSFDRYFPSFYKFQQAPGANSPIEISPHSISVRLPDTMTGKQFSTRLEEELASASLHQFTNRLSTRRHFARLRAPSAIAQRFSRDAYGGVDRISRATELYCCRTHYDGDRLVRIAENIILRHMGLIA